MLCSLLLGAVISTHRQGKLHRLIIAFTKLHRMFQVFFVSCTVSTIVVCAVKPAVADTLDAQKLPQ